MVFKFIVMKKIFFLGLLFLVSAVDAQVFEENFNAPFALTTSFNKTINGVVFTFTFTTDGDGGDFSSDNINGEGNSASVNLWSGNFNLGTTERVTIKRNDGASFKFTSIFINNTAGSTIAVAGYLSNSLVGSVLNANTGFNNTLNFGNIVVNEVRLTATDFVNSNIDSFKGDFNSSLSNNQSDYQDLSMFLSPNPVRNYIVVTSLSTENKFSIYNLLGSKVQEGELFDNKKIDVGQLENGFYFFKFGEGKSIKFIKE